MPSTAVTFTSVGDKMSGILHLPDNFDSKNQYPAILTTGPMATVKEQAAGVFAKALAAEGFITLAFDYRRFGESGGGTKAI